MTWNASIVCIIVSPCKNRPVKSVTLSGYFLWTNIIKLPDVSFSLSCASVSASMLIVANSGYNTVDAQLFEVVNAGTLAGGSLEWAEFSQRLEQLSSFLLRRSDGSRMLNHTSFREWLMWREEGQDDRFLCDPRYSQPEGMSDKWREKKTGTDVSHWAVSLFPGVATLSCPSGSADRQESWPDSRRWSSGITSWRRTSTRRALTHKVRHAYADTWGWKPHQEIVFTDHKPMRWHCFMSNCWFLSHLFSSSRAWVRS